MANMNDRERIEFMARIKDIAAYAQALGPNVEPVFDLYQCTSCGLVAPLVPTMPRNAPRECYRRTCRNREFNYMGKSPAGFGTSIIKMITSSIDRHNREIDAGPETELLLPSGLNLRIHRN